MLLDPFSLFREMVIQSALKVSDSSSNNYVVNKDGNSGDTHRQTTSGSALFMNNRDSEDADYKQRVNKVIQNFLADCL